MSKSEFNRINRFEEKMAATYSPDGPVWLPSGDDAAVLRSTGDVVVCTDMLVANQHFKREYASPYDIGHKALTVNVSDIAAMGATPTAAVIALAIDHSTWSEQDLDELYDGLRDAATTYGVVLAGGDTVSAEVFSITVTLIGTAEAPIVTRTNAQAGDVVVVVGHLGSSAAGLLALQQGNVDAVSPVLKQAHTRPTAQVIAGKWLATIGATSMIDISDGLGADLLHLCVGSQVEIGVTYDWIKQLIHPDFFEVIRAIQAQTSCANATSGTLSAVNGVENSRSVVNGLSGDLSAVNEAKNNTSVVNGSTSQEHLTALSAGQTHGANVGDVEGRGVSSTVNPTPDLLLRTLCGGEDFALAATLELTKAQDFIAEFTAQFPDTPAAIIGLVGPIEKEVDVTLFGYYPNEPNTTISIGDLGWDHG